MVYMVPWHTWLLCIRKFHVQEYTLGLYGTVVFIIGKNTCISVPWLFKSVFKGQPYIHIYIHTHTHQTVAQLVKNLPGREGDTIDAGSGSGLGRFPGERNDNPLLYSCLENSMDRGSWRDLVHGVSKELDRTEHVHMHTLRLSVSQRRLFRRD